jgi:hypothetical protein
MNLALAQECAFPPLPCVVANLRIVLVVEDERAVREATCEVLRGLDYLVFAAESGQPREISF